MFTVITTAQATTTSNLILPVSYFVNHTSLINHLEKNLVKYKKVSIIGYSGIGKTQIARMYSWQKKNLYNFIWFFDSNLDLEQEYLKLAKAINKRYNNSIITEDSLHAKKEVLEFLKARKDWLLIFDNLHLGQNNKVKDIIKWENNGHIIFCSQDSANLPHIISSIKFQYNDAQELAKSILENDKFTNFLATQFVDYPILIVNGAQIINTYKGMTFDEYKKLILDSNDYIKTNLEIAIKELPKTANELLLTIALINNQKFSRQLLTMILAREVQDDLLYLLRLSLINCVDANVDNPVYEMHDVFADKLQEIYSGNSIKKILELIISNFRLSTSSNVQEAHKIKTSITVQENLEIILQNAEKHSVDIKKILDIRHHLLTNYVNTHDHYNAQIAEEWYKKNKGIIRNLSLSNSEQEIMASFLNALSCFYRVALTNHTKALKYALEAKEILNSIGTNIEKRLQILYQVIKAQTALAKIEDAETTLLEMETLTQDSQDNNGFIYFAKANLLFYKGNYVTALEALDKYLETSYAKNIKKADLLLTGAYMLKIDILNQLKKYKEALDISALLYEMHKKTKPEDHEIFARLFTKISESELGMKNINKALLNITKANNIFLFNIRKYSNGELVLYSSNQDLAQNYKIKANILSEIGQYTESIENYVNSATIYQNLYKHNLGKVEHISDMFLYAASSACLNKDTKNAKYFFKLQLKNFKHSHRNSIPIINFCKNQGIIFY